MKTTTIYVKVKDDNKCIATCISTGEIDKTVSAANNNFFGLSFKGDTTCYIYCNGKKLDEEIKGVKNNKRYYILTPRAYRKTMETLEKFGIFNIIRIGF